MVCKAVIFDYIGTLVNCKNYTMDASKLNLYNSLVAEGFAVEKDRFLAAYNLSHEKYRVVRYGELREVTNAVWVAEALCSLGIEVSPEDCRIKNDLNVFFKDFINTLELRDGAKKLIKHAQGLGKVGLISNFTHAPVIYKSLGVLEISEFFNAVVVSEEVGWRKPSSFIFQHALSRLKVRAAEAVYIGDSPIEDIEGAKAGGLKTVFVPSQFHSLKDLKESKQEPDGIVKDLSSIPQKITEIFSQ
jgi:FMN phosphatase YigB (HAD superfamily)